MAKFIKKCPHCGANLRVSDEWIGKTIRCLACGKQFVLQSSKNVNIADSVEENEISAKRPYCGSDHQSGAKYYSECGKDALDKLENWFGWISAGLWVGFIWIFVKCGLWEKLKLWSFVLVGAGTIFCAVLPYMVRKILSSVWRPSQEDVRKGIKLLSAILVAIMALGVGYWWASRPAAPQSAAHRPAAPQAATPAATSQAPIASTSSQKKRVWVTFDLNLPGGVELTMVKIKAGAFMMGSPKNEVGRDDYEKQHHVTLTKDYWLGKYEVTEKQWRAVMGMGNNMFFLGDNLPMGGVSWDKAKLFCDKLNKLFAGKLPKGYRFDLPTEAQWEYACRAGTTTALNSGKDLTSEKATCPNLDEVGWYRGNSGWKEHPVGQKRPNAWGLYDMHGNVWEWCRDWRSSYGGEATDPTGPATDPTAPMCVGDRVLRGGSYNCEARACRSATRSCGSSSVGGSSDGFRLALVPVQ